MEVNHGSHICGLHYSPTVLGLCTRLLLKLPMIDSVILCSY